MNEAQHLYRVEERRFSAGVDEMGDPLPRRGDMEIRLFAVPVRKRTPKGWRLEDGTFVLESATKKYACLTVEEAFVSFAARKQRQADILMARAADALEAKRGAERLKEKLIAGMPQPVRPWWRNSHARTDSWRDGVTVRAEETRR